MSVIGVALYRCLLGLTVCCEILVGYSATNLARADPATFEFVNATATFNITMDSFDAVATISDSFTVDYTTQTVTSINVALSGLPSFLSYFEIYPYTDILYTFYDAQQFLAINPPNTAGLQPHFLYSFDHPGADPLIDLVLYTNEFGPRFPVSVTGGVVPVPEPSSLLLMLFPILVMAVTAALIGRSKATNDPPVLCWSGGVGRAT